MRSRREATLASVLAQGPAELGGIDPSLQIRDSLSLTLCLAMHRVLKPLHQVLEVSDPSLKRADQLPVGECAASLRRFAGRLGTAAHLADPVNQPLTIAHGSPPDAYRSSTAAASAGSGAGFSEARL